MKPNWIKHESIKTSRVRFRNLPVYFYNCQDSNALMKAFEKYAGIFNGVIFSAKENVKTFYKRTVISEESDKINKKFSFVYFASKN